MKSSQQRSIYWTFEYNISPNGFELYDWFKLFLFISFENTWVLRKRIPFALGVLLFTDLMRHKTHQINEMELNVRS